MEVSLSIPNEQKIIGLEMDGHMTREAVAPCSLCDAA